MRLGARSRGSVSIEIKSVNQRFLDLKLSLPKEYAAWESEVRKLVQERVGRGRVEIYVGRTVATGILRLEDNATATTTAGVGIADSFTPGSLLGTISTSSVMRTREPITAPRATQDAGRLMTLGFPPSRKTLR